MLLSAGAEEEFLEDLTLALEEPRAGAEGRGATGMNGAAAGAASAVIGVGEAEEGGQEERVPAEVGAALAQHYWRARQFEAHSALVRQRALLGHWLQRFRAHLEEQRQEEQEVRRRRQEEEQHRRQEEEEERRKKAAAKQQKQKQVQQDQSRQEMKQKQGEHPQANPLKRAAGGAAGAPGAGSRLLKAGAEKRSR